MFREDVIYYHRMNEKPFGRAIAFVGPPHSGKSVFLAELYRQFLGDKAVGQKAFLQRACPDGEGMWSAESDPEVVKKIRQKGSFDEPTMSFFIQSIRGLRKTKSIVLVDCGGRRSTQNAVILGECSDAIILSSKPEELELWKTFCEENGVKVLAMLKSELLTPEQRIELDLAINEGNEIPKELLSEVSVEEDIAKGVMRDLDRGRPPVAYKDAMAVLESDLANKMIFPREGNEAGAEIKKN